MSYGSIKNQSREHLNFAVNLVSNNIIQIRLVSMIYGGSFDKENTMKALTRERLYQSRVSLNGTFSLIIHAFKPPLR